MHGCAVFLVPKQGVCALRGRAVQALHRRLRDCIDCMGIGANMPRSDHVAEEGQALPAALAGSIAAKDLGDVR